MLSIQQPAIGAQLLLRYSTKHTRKHPETETCTDGRPVWTTRNLKDCLENDERPVSTVFIRNKQVDGMSRPSSRTLPERCRERAGARERSAWTSLCSAGSSCYGELHQ